MLLGEMHRRFAMRTCSFGQQKESFSKVGSFKAETFDELFEKTKSTSVGELYSEERKILGDEGCIRRVDKLFSPSDIQSIMKKAMVERLRRIYGIEWFQEGWTGLPDPCISDERYRDDRDRYTSGVSLHKRGYRQMTVKAPITETLASALIMLTPWHKDRILVDPFCGSGTFPIEAALMAANIAPGMNRSFTAEEWVNLIPKKAWYDAMDEANDVIDRKVQVDIQGYDLNPEAVKAARQNAKDAGVDHLIHFQERAVKDLSHPKKYGFIITNPPYGERLEDKKDLPQLYREFGESFKKLDSWSAYMITQLRGCRTLFRKKSG